MNRQNKSILAVILFVSFVVIASPYAVGAFSNTWRGTSWIGDGKTIQSSKTGDNFQYLKHTAEDLQSQVTDIKSRLNSIEDIISSDDSCVVTVSNSVSCTATADCNCGSNGCDTCSFTGEQATYNIDCDGSDMSTITGPCINLSDPTQLTGC